MFVVFDEKKMFRFATQITHTKHYHIAAVISVGSNMTKSEKAKNAKLIHILMLVARQTTVLHYFKIQI